MGKNAAAVLLLVLLFAAAAPQLTRSQTRPRRAEPATSKPAPSPAPSVESARPGSATSQQQPSPSTSPSASPSTTKTAAVQQDAQEEVGPDDVLRINTTLVMVPVSITDRSGRSIVDLQKEDFHLYEDGVEQQVAYFATVEKPFTVVLMIDTSASTWSKLSQIKEAAWTFVEQLRPDDRVMVVSFARGLTVKCQATTDRQKIRKAIEDTGKGLSTHLYDAMDKLMRKQLAGIQGRKAVVLFTDGVDASSNDATYQSTVHLAEEFDALIYPIRYDTYDPAHDNGGGSSSPPPSTGSRMPSILRKLPFPMPTINIGGGGGGSNGSSRADYERGERYLHELAELTGGRVYEASKDLRYLQDAFSHIAEELRRQYSLGYYPQQAAQKGERHRIKVSVNRTDVAVRARPGYVYGGTTTGSETPSPSSTAKDKEGPSPAPVLQKKPFVSRLY